MATRAADRHSGSIWFALCAAPLAWLAQLLLGWYFGARICEPMSVGSVKAAVAIVSVIALATAVLSASLGWRNWRASTSMPHPVVSDASDRREFLALAGLLISASFTLAIAWGGFASIALVNCGRTR
jgi:hypothetical protein